MRLFRKLLIFSVSSLALAAGARAAEITTQTASPVRTSTANAGAAGDLTITENGSIEVEDMPGFTAVTVDTDHDVIIDGVILIEESDDTTGVHILPGLQTNLTLGGNI
ncbi:MAG: hypothetical protein ACK4Y9_12220, partial [Hyphomonas sp.]